jgi:hypothetical protein
MVVGLVLVLVVAIAVVVLVAPLVLVVLVLVVAVLKTGLAGMSRHGHWRTTSCCE